MSAQVYIMPRLFCPAMPKVVMQKVTKPDAPRWEPPDPGTPEYEASKARAQQAQRDERIAAGLCIEHGIPLIEGSCRLCTAKTMAKVDRVIAHLTGDVS